MWSWVLTIVGVTGFLLAGQKIWWAWYLNIANQALWLSYGVVTEQWGFVAGGVVYTVVFVRNAAVWTREHRADREDHTEVLLAESRRRTWPRA
jgi:hypothetical protein